MPLEEDILKKYRTKIEGEVDLESEGQVPDSSAQIFSQEYTQLKQEILSKKRSSYENWCNTFEKILALRPNKKLLPELERAIETAHLDVTPTGAASFAVFIAFFIILLGVIITLLSLFLFKTIPLFTFLIFLILGVIVLFQFPKLPIIIAARWRLKASNQMVLCILYVVIYMRHTSNLEHAIKFAAEHTDVPLALDLRKIFWDVEIGKYSTIKESLDFYLESWRHYNLEFVTAFHLIESSLYEPTETRRKELLEKALEVILEGSYEKMMHYAQEIKSPITTLHMLGVILPILGLVVFPLIGVFLRGLVKWYHLAFLYNLVLPLLVYFLGINILSKRPTGYGASKVAEKVYKQAFSPFFICLLIFILFAIVGLSPMIYRMISPTPTPIPDSCPQGDFAVGPLGCFFGYVEFNDRVYGPFGIGSLFLSFFLPAGLALALGINYKIRTKKIIELRNETKELESEFASALFQLGNRMGDGIPAEIAFSKVSETLEGTPSGNFFRIVDTNIRQLGMGMKEAIFDEKVGAILSYPSPLIESSMEVLLEGAKKGPLIVSQSLISISTYVDRIHKVSERLKDLLAEVISSMKSQISFLTPMIAGIVVGISTMIITIILELTTKISALSGEEGLGGSLGALRGLFDVPGIIPGYYFQLIVGFYVVQLAYVLTIIQNGIENGPDKLYEQYLLGKNITKSFFIYAIIAIAISVLFTGLAVAVLSGTQGG